MRRAISVLALCAAAFPAAAQSGVYYEIPGWNNAYALTPDGKRVAGRAGANAAVLDVVTHTQTVLGLGSASGISDDGSVVVIQNGSTLQRWTATGGGLTIAINAQDYSAHLSGDGLTIVYNSRDFHGYRWAAESGLQPVPSLPGSFDTLVYQASRDGRTIVGSLTGMTPQGQSGTWPVVWHDLVPVIAGPSPAIPNAVLSVVSADGMVAYGTRQEEEVTDTFRWTAETGSVNLGFPVLGLPTATTPDGQICVGTLANGLAFAWRSGAAPRTIAEILANDFGISPDDRLFIGIYGLSADARVVAGTSKVISTNGRVGWVVTLPRPLLAPPVQCYANCDGSTVSPVLNINDFICFQQKFIAGDPLANCDNSTSPPLLNINDFICFQTRFTAGCP